jgi:mycobactin lysine-N-oxygenase
MPQQNIAVIGAGPKAAALAAKAYCLQQEGYEVAVSVFERSEIGANWSGNHGYTDGVQRLCTPAERDLGFPYGTTFGTDVVELMQSRFSWNAFLVAQAKDSDRYSDWVNRGRRPPSHGDFKDYLRFAFEQALVDPALGRVTKIIEDAGTRTIRQIDAATKDIIHWPGFHGVVFTGPGPASKKPPQVKDPRVLSGVDFWSHLARVRKALDVIKDKPIVIVGGGGTAAAITAWFVREGVRSQPINLINSQAMLFTRTTNFFENSLFDDEETWFALHPTVRSEFTKRLNRGVVWETISSLLADAENLTLLPGTATDIRHTAPPSPRALPELEVEYRNHKGTHPLPAGLVIDATGFDPWAFEVLTPPDVRAELVEARRETLTNDMRDDLSLPLPGFPRIHTPGLADAQGPGFGSLMVLGAMADKILSPDYDAATP